MESLLKAWFKKKFSDYLGTFDSSFIFFFKAVERYGS